MQEKILRYVEKKFGKNVEDFTNGETKELFYMMRDMDKKRKMHYNYYTEGEWGKATNYTMTLNSSKLGFDKCIDIISEL